MKPRKSQYLFAALLAVALLAPAVVAGQEADPAASPTPDGGRRALPSSTPRHISLSLYFRRPAKVIPIHREEGETAIPVEDFEIVEEKPWLTEDDVGWIDYRPEDNPTFLRLLLTRQGNWKYREAMAGNFGRTILLVIDGTVRATQQMVLTERRDRIDFTGNFPVSELETIQSQFSARPIPSPSPEPSPTPVPRDRFIIR